MTVQGKNKNASGGCESMSSFLKYNRTLGDRFLKKNSQDNNNTQNKQRQANTRSFAVSFIGLAGTFPVNDFYLHSKWFWFQGMI